jgi:hypothetical protein
MMKMRMTWMTWSKRRPSAVVDTVASEQRVGSKAVYPEAMEASANIRSSLRVHLVRTLKAAGVWATRSWYGS